MPLAGDSSAVGLLGSISTVGSVLFIVRGLMFVLALLYFFFTLIIIRQVFLMTETLITEFGPALKLFTIAYAALALGVLVLFFLKLFI